MYGSFECYNGNQDYLTTNAVIDITYELQSDTDKKSRIQTFPLNPDVPYITEDEAYMMDWIYNRDEGIQKIYPDSIQYPEFIFEQPLRFVGSILDAYNMTVAINEENISPPPKRKLRLTQF